MRGVRGAILSLMLLAVAAPSAATEVATSSASSRSLLEATPPAPEAESVLSSRWFWLGLIGVVMAGSAAAYVAFRRPPHYTQLCEGEPDRCR